MVSFQKFKNAVVDFYRLKIEMPVDMLIASAKNEDGVLDARSIIILVIGIYLLAALLPASITALNGANTSGWTATQIAIWAVVSIVILAVVIMKVAE